MKKRGRRQKGQRGAEEGDDENTGDEKKEQGIQQAVTSVRGGEEERLSGG